MAISQNGNTSWAYAASGSITRAMPTHVTGDMLLVRVAYKSSAIATCTASTATSGWAKVSTEFHNGTTNSGNGVGSVAVATFWKEAASASEPSMQVDFSQAVTQVGHCCVGYSKGAGEAWDTPVGDGGGDTAAGTSHSATIQSHVSVLSGDMVDFFTGICDDTTMTVPTITQTGVTFAAVTEMPAAQGTDTSGADGAYDGGYRLDTSGTSSAAAVVTGTLSTSETGASWMTRLRVAAGGTNAAAGHASGTASAFAASILLAVSAGLASGSGAAFNATTQVSKTVSAEVATGTGQAFNIGGTISFTSGHASGTGLARQASANIQPNAGHASGTGSAGDIDATVVGRPGAASGTGAAFNPSVAIAVNAGHASGTGSAFNATAQPGKAAAAGHAAGTGVANNPTPALASSAGSAGGSGTAGGPDAAIAVGPGVAAGTGQAFNATVSTASFVNVAAGHASGTGSAFNPTLALAGAPNIATGTGAAGGPSSSVGVHGGAATGTGSAFDATGSTATLVDVDAGHASGSGQAFNATVQAIGVTPVTDEFRGGRTVRFEKIPNEAIKVYPEAAEGTGQAFDATVEWDDDEFAIALLLGAV